MAASERQSTPGPTKRDPEATLVQRFLPSFDVSDTLAIEVAADAERTWRALNAADLIEVGRRRRVVGVLGALRGLPEVAAGLIQGRGLPPRPQRLTLRDTANPALGPGAWILLGERPPRELALGLIGKFWRPVIEYAKCDAESFADFSQAGFAKTVYALRLEDSREGAVQLSATMRTASTDERSRRLFDRYWTLGVGSGAHVLVRGLLEVVKEDAEGGTSP